MPAVQDLSDVAFIQMLYKIKSMGQLLVNELNSDADNKPHCFGRDQAYLLMRFPNRAFPDHINSDNCFA